jgi:Phage P22-like portal protein
LKPTSKRPAKQPDSEFFRIMRERFELGRTIDTTDREIAKEDVKFAAGDQWDPDIKLRRKEAHRPTLTENRLGPSIRQIVNEGRENKPSILCTPMDGGTEENADYFQGRIRQLEYECNADVAYDTSREHQVICGRGFYRVTTRERSDGSQYACIEPVNNQFAVVWDPAAKEYDLADADWWFVVRTMSTEAHERAFGTDTEASRGGFFLDGENPAPGWMGTGKDGKMVQVGDYYYRDYDDLTDAGEPTVKIMATNGIESLDETSWIDPEGIIPMIPVWGQQMVVDDEMRTFSLIRDAKDPQRLVNLYASNIAEEIGRIPKTPFLAAEGQIDGREEEWRTINEVQRAVVLYKTRSVDGDIVGAPQREASEPPIQALVTGYLQAVDSVKAAMGIFDASLGAGPAQEPGIAIQQRRQESDVANFHFSDNEARSRKKLGRILLRILPMLDGDEPADKPVRDLDGKVRMVRINEPYIHPKTKQPVIHKMSDPGRYEVGISTGPSYTSQREQENERQGELIKAVPDLVWIIGDLYFRSSDGPGAEQIADRMQRAIGLRTPGLIDDETQDPKKQLQQAAQKAQQLGVMNQQLTQEVHRLAQIIESKQLEQETKFKVAALQSWTTIRAAEIKATLETGIADADREGARLEMMFDNAHEVGMAAMQHGHDVLQQQQAGDQQQQAAEQQQDAAQQQQSAQHAHEADQSAAATVAQQQAAEQQQQQQQSQQ